MSTADPPRAAGAPVFLSGGGDMGARIRAYGWAATALGEPVGWPQPLKTLVGVMLAAAQPMFVAWGPARTMLYNDGYVAILGAKHPAALGRPFFEVWHELVDFLAPLVERVFGGEPVHMDDIALPLDRRADGVLDEAHFVFSYTPVRDEAGAVAGLFCSCTETTQTVLAHRQARRDRERLAQLFEQGPSFMALLSGPEHRFELANADYLRLIGDRALVGKTFAEALPDAVEQGYLELLDGVFASGKAVSFRGAKYLMRTAADAPVSLRYVDYIYQPITDIDGRVSAIFVEGSDVTDRALAEIALRENERNLRALNAELERRVIAESTARGRTWALSADLLGVLNSDGFFESSNPAWARVLGWSEAELRITSIFELMHPDDIQTTRGGFDRLALGTPAINFQNRYRRKDGGYRWFSWLGVPGDGKFYCVGRDITDERLRSAELAERTAERDRIWQNSRDLQIICDRAAVFLSVNPAFTQILGYSADEAVGRSFLDFLDAEEYRRSEQRFGSMLGGDALNNFENCYRHKDGSVRWIAWHTTLESDLVYGYGRDVTAERLAREELACAQDSLRQSQKLEAMGQLTGGVAHDFNNLLTPIIGSLDLLQRRGVGGEREQKLIAGALRASDRAKTLVQRLLAFARRQPLQPVAVDVAALVNGMASLIGSTLGPQISVVVDVATDLPAATADPNQLEMAILNLSVNARDAMTQGGTLRISATAEVVRAGHRSQLRAGDYVRLSVADSGAGMDAVTLARAIEPFFSTKGIGKGTGLGLSMVHGLAAQLGGTLTISSTPGLGTNVELWLPASTAIAETATIAAQGGCAPPTVGTVLLVDDEDGVRMITADMLGELGYAVLEAASAAEALKVIGAGTHIDALITDHLMPGMTGVELAYAVREQRPQTPVLIVSGFADADGIAPDLPRLSKPFRQADLAASVAALAAGPS